MTSFAVADPGLTTHSDDEIVAAGYNAFVLAHRRKRPDAEQVGLNVIVQMTGEPEGSAVDRYRERCMIAREERNARS